MITFVWAEDENGLIGKNGELPWHLPADMQFFKEVTLTGDVVMGRKTLDSIPNPPLKKRENFVLTSNPSFDLEGIHVCHSKKEILDKTEDSKKPLHVIGGVSLFELFIDDVDMLYRTVIHDSFEGDTYMPAIDYSQFELIEEKKGAVDAKNKHPHTFQIFKRK
ncbi:dihydrofolate reductase [Alkalibacterium subtropicum]|uniref:Dihydrofolate reductase n=1 Tax=Alkalibacterium subtropicum TaxID=753702 RepID=A0A1I1KTZ7_9LACT|nr:dihydrofolate reductase [Alkalibacterium subtropicum]SFC64095.1 dihydrofolate reductase [Alkalibacterium subtropicum]